MSAIILTATIERFPTAGSWTISRDSITEVVVVTAHASQNGMTGRGECRPYPRYDEFPEGVVADIEAVAPQLGADSAAVDLNTLMAPGAARNAVDCALWDLRAKLAGKPVWQLAGLPEPKPLITAYSLSLDTPEAMQAKAVENAHRPLLKVKLGGEGDLERIRAVRAGAPDADIIVDANEGWTPESYTELAPELLALGSRWSNNPCPPGTTTPWPIWNAPCPSAPTRPAMTPPRWRRWRGNTTWSTSSSTRPAALPRRYC
jgi:L-alanine-DL-glutamate epimerase-like enolase superfamily enzyme